MVIITRSCQTAAKVYSWPGEAMVLAELAVNGARLSSTEHYEQQLDTAPAAYASTVLS